MAALEAIVAVDQNWGIGHQDELLFRIRADLQRFKAMTLGQVVILGRKTLQTFPGGRPLPGRVNLVLTRNPDWTVEGATVCHSRDEVLRAVLAHPDKQIFVIGGSSVYRAFLSDCQRIHVTRIHDQRPADSFFPNLDALPDWQMVWSSPDQEENGLVFTFLTYEKKQD